MREIRLSEQELEELKRLIHEAKITPVIGFSMRQMMEGRDLASQAWDRVRRYWDELGEKYGFDPQAIRGIDAQTGEVILA